MEWSSQVVTFLLARKERGIRFSVAWEEAMLRFPPRGIAVRQSARMAADEPIPAFLRRVCDDAWHGRQPELRHLSADLMSLPEQERIGPRLGVRGTRPADRVA